jgi:ABC-type phosphate transport system auxiliary subunit
MKNIEKNLDYLKIVAISYSLIAVVALILLIRYRKIFGFWSKIILQAMILINVSKTVLNILSIENYNPMQQNFI